MWFPAYDSFSHIAVSQLISTMFTTLRSRRLGQTVLVCMYNNNPSSATYIVTGHHVTYVSRHAKRDLLGVIIENRFFAYAYVNSFIFPESEYVRYMKLRQL